MRFKAAIFHTNYSTSAPPPPPPMWVESVNFVARPVEPHKDGRMAERRGVEVPSRKTR